MVEIKISLTDEEYKLLDYHIFSVSEWFKNLALSKYKSYLEEHILPVIFEDNTEGLTLEEKTDLKNRIGFVPSIENIPDNLKTEIVQKIDLGKFNSNE